MASMAPSHDDQLGEVEWLREVNKVVDNALAELNHGYPTLFDDIDLTVKNALAEPDYGSPNLFEELNWTMEGNKAFEDGLIKPNHGSSDLFGWTTSGESTTFGNTLAELDHYGSSNQVELRDPAQVQINDFIEDVQMTEASLVILPNNTGSTSTVSERKAKRPRKKPIRWTSEEHRLFLEGLEKYGKGDWRSISRFSVVTRTPSQVASHAQKYFNRLKKSQNNHGTLTPLPATNAAAPSPY